MPRALLTLLALFAFAACDSSTPEAAPPDPVDPPDERFRIAVVAETPSGEAVEGLRVAIRPCFDVTFTGGQADDCLAAVPAKPRVPAAASPVEYGLIEVEYVSEAGGATIDIALVWETFAETNNRGFEVQMRRGDEAPFEVLGFVDGAGTIMELQRYRFETTIAEGAYDLRLRQEDLDGTSTFSFEVQAIYTRPSFPTQLNTAYPTPFVVITRFDYTVGTDGLDLTFEITDLSDAVVARLEGPTLFGNHTLVWESVDQPSGVYVVRMKDGDTVLDSLAVARWAILAPDATEGPDVRGTTDAAGAFETLDVTLAPAFYGPAEIEYRGEANEDLGTFSMPERVRITLIDPSTGAQQTYDRAIVDGPNAFALTWTP
ncbi:MAG: hypothetical protein AAGF99_14460 [Bacteroidota bacterium]